LDYRNSGDVTGDKQGVVGYAAIAFYGESHASFTAADRARLLALARKGLEDAVRNGRAYQPDLAGLPSNYTERKGCFVTLTKKGTLRGCKGNIYPQLPLYEAIAENACQSALYDPRFEPVRVEELKDLSIEVSVLTEPHPLAFTSPEDLLRKLRPHRDGVVLQIGGRGATYLPQVWAQLPDKVAFLNSLAQKAGCEPSAWRGPGTSILIYEVESFQEGERH
jgi:AmmeMemoRadiSam system protein A